MMKRRCVIALFSFCALLTPVAFAQQNAFVCFSANGAQLAIEHINCDAVVGSSTSITAFPKTDVFGAELSGKLTGDLGDVQGGEIDVPCQSQPTVSLSTLYEPGVHTLQAQFNGCFDFPGTYTGTLIVIVPPYTSPNGSNPPPPPPPCGVTMIDPISSTPKLWLGDHITNRPYDLANAFPTVDGVAADGVTEVLLRINTTDSASVTVNLIDGSGGNSTSPDEIGGLTGLDGGAPASSVTVNADDEGSGPYAYVLYHAPLNFTRANTAADAEVFSRQVQLQTSCADSNGASNATTNVKIVRPPIILVHGLWSNASDAWTHFVPVKDAENTFWSNLPLNSVLPVNYDVPPDSPIISTVPSYTSSITNAITRNSLGFAYNAPFVLKTMQDYITAFKGTFNVADVQADVVAHSMGGDIARTMVTLPDFSSGDTYGQGLIHKLITIDTPHQGTPLATQMLDASNACVAGKLAEKGDISLASVTQNGNTIIPGAMGDLQTGVQGDIPFPIAYVAGAALQSNLSGLDCSLCTSTFLKFRCGTLSGDPLANDLTSANWPSIFGESNDAIVPLSSELNGTTNQLLVFPNVIHTSAIENLDFIGPGALDSGSGIPDKTVDLLNEAVAGSDFQH